MAVSPELQDALWDIAGRLADVAAAEALPHFRRGDLRADNKQVTGFDPVTVADRGAETAMRDLLARERPLDAIRGEEFADRSGTSGLTWVLDPIDGTRAFISGAPTWGVLIGLDAGAGPELGVIDQPHLRERFIGGFGRAEFQTPAGKDRLAVRDCTGLAEAVLYTTRPDIGTDAERAAFNQVRDRVRLDRYGFDCYAFALLALGHVDLVIEAGLAAHDIHGPVAVIEAAGGIVTDWRGGPAYQGGRCLAAGDRRAHAAALEILAAVDD